MLLNIKITGQVNFVSNPSFEIYDTCPNWTGQIYRAKDWFQPRAFLGSTITASSSDYFNTCTSVPFISIPNNGGGTQLPNNGNAYAGIVVFDTITTPLLLSGREYLENKLIAPLRANRTYCVSFYVSLGENSSYSIGSFGAYFSQDSALTNFISGFPMPPPLLPFVPQVITDGNIINDTINWVKISSYYISHGGESYITIGNFNAFTTTIWQTEAGTNNLAYYYIDDVSVIDCDKDIEIPNIFTPNNDDVNDNFQITSSSLKIFNCKIYNRWGILVGELKDVNDMWDGRTTAGIECSDGVYFYILTAKGIDDKEYNQRGFVQLIK